MASDTVDSFLDQAEERAQNDPVELTVRELLKHWDAMRRGSSVIRQINRVRKEAPPATPATPEDILLLRQIRDSLTK